LDPFGCEIIGDLSQPLMPADVELLSRHLQQDNLLVAHGQSLSDADHVRVMEYLGEVLELDDHRSFEFVANQPELGKLGAEEIAWHSDMAFHVSPWRVLSLYAVDVVNGASSTLFASGTRAYNRLSPQLRDLIADLDALHLFALEFSGRNRTESLDSSAPRAVHPVVMRHAVTAMPFLFVSWQQTDSVVGLDQRASDVLLSSLFECLYAPNNVVSHRWAPGDLVVWDNLAIQHCRGNLETVGRRVLRKVIIGDQTLNDAFPQLAGMSLEQMRVLLTPKDPST
jgi:taurine dioxygenase